MDLREEKIGEVSVVAVAGRIDSTTAPALGEQLTLSLQAPKVRVVLDLSRLEYHQQRGVQDTADRRQARRRGREPISLVRGGGEGKATL